MCEHLTFPDGSTAIRCGLRRRRRYCACGRASEFLCDWKVAGNKSGTCDKPVCPQHALQVAPDRHLCPEHQRAFESWKHRHPGVDVNELRRQTVAAEQPNLFEEAK
jgi:hypothetical protein